MKSPSRSPEETTEDDDNVKVLPLTTEALNYHNALSSNKSDAGSTSSKLSTLQQQMKTARGRQHIHVTMVIKMLLYLNMMEIVCSVLVGFVVGFVYSLANIYDKSSDLQRNSSVVLFVSCLSLSVFALFNIAVLFKSENEQISIGACFESMKRYATFLQIVYLCLLGSCVVSVGFVIQGLIIVGSNSNSKEATFNCIYSIGALLLPAFFMALENCVVRYRQKLTRDYRSSSNNNNNNNNAKMMDLVSRMECSKDIDGDTHSDNGSMLSKLSSDVEIGNERATQ